MSSAVLAALNMWLEYHGIFQHYIDYSDGADRDLEQEKER